MIFHFAWVFGNLSELFLWNRINNKLLRLPHADNLALGHEAAPETQLPQSRVGLRVMHRVTVAGKTPPKK